MLNLSTNALILLLTGLNLNLSESVTIISSLMPKNNIFPNWSLHHLIIHGASANCQQTLKPQIKSCSVVANKPIGVQMYTITGFSNHYVAVYCTTHRKQFHIINHSRTIAITATVANGAVRLSILLRLVGFINVFQKVDANGHHKVESVAKIIIFE